MAYINKGFSINVWKIQIGARFNPSTCMYTGDFLPTIILVVTVVKILSDMFVDLYNLF